jgi:hypothetical protein
MRPARLPHKITLKQLRVGNQALNKSKGDGLGECLGVVEADFHFHVAEVAAVKAFGDV